MASKQIVKEVVHVDSLSGSGFVFSYNDEDERYHTSDYTTLADLCKGQLEFQLGEEIEPEKQYEIEMIIKEVK